MNGAVTSIVTVFTAIISLAALSVILSKRSDTSNVITSAFGGLATAIGAATAPTTGGGGSSSTFFGGNPLSGILSQF